MKKRDSLINRLRDLKRLVKRPFSRRTGQESDPPNTSKTESSRKAEVFDRLDSELNQHNSKKSIKTFRLNHHGDQSIWDHYEQTSEVVGKGLAGSVVIIRGKTSKEAYALKTLEISKNITTPQQDLIINEVSNYLKLDHPNIAKLLGTFLFNSFRCIH